MSEIKEQCMKALQNFLVATIELKVVADEEQPELSADFQKLIELTEVALIAIPTNDDIVAILIAEDIHAMGIKLDERIRSK